MSGHYYVKEATGRWQKKLLIFAIKARTIKKDPWPMAGETASTEETPEGWKMQLMPAAIMRTKADIIT
jgi:hypothetical protein